MAPGAATGIGSPVTVLVAVLMTLMEVLWLPPSKNSELPSGEIARFDTGPVAIGDPTAGPVGRPLSVEISTTRPVPDSAT